MTRRPKLIIGGVVAALVLTAWFCAPAYVKYRIHKDHPDVHVDDVSLRWKTVELRGVHVDRGWVTAQFDAATVDWSQTTIDARGGTATVDLDKRPPEKEGAEKRAVTLHDVVVHVTKGELSADLFGVSYENGKVCFTQATAKHPKGTGEAQNGCVTKNADGSQEATVETATLTPLIEIPHLAPHETVQLQGAKLKILAQMPQTFSAFSILTTVVDPRGQKTPLLLGDVSISRLPDGQSVNVSVGSTTLTHAWLSPSLVTFPRMTVSVNDPLTMPNKLNVSINHVTVEIATDDLRFVATDQPCQDWIEALPKELRSGPLQDATFTGTLGFDIQLKPKATVKIKSTCKADCSAPSLQVLKKEFTYTAYDSKNVEFQRHAGPGTLEWIPITHINPNVPLAALEMEDRAFPYHHGFIPQALENSLDEDMKEGKFVRGGSTLTMQLAKNLWLKRDKTLGRKAEELLLTQALEGCFSKDQLMELYLNVVELGPDLYGIGPAAEHYFQLSPMELDPGQSFYLASLLPNPRKAPPLDAATMARMTKLMGTLVKAGRIPDAFLLSFEKPDTTGWSAP